MITNLQDLILINCFIVIYFSISYLKTNIVFNLDFLHLIFPLQIFEFRSCLQIFEKT